MDGALKEHCKQALLLAIGRDCVDYSGMANMSLEDVFTRGIVVSPGDDPTPPASQ